MKYIQNVIAFLLLLRDAEGTAGANGYRLMYGNRLFTDFRSHPNDPLNGMTAAGAYQITYPTWISLQAKISLPDFTPPNQDKGCIELIRGKGALSLVQTGDIEGAIQKLSGIWSSLPGGIHQRRTIAQATNFYQQNGGIV